MRKLWMVGVLLGMVGCQNVQGPFAAREPMRVDDPRFPIAEQERRGRDRLALPEDRSALAPKLYIDRPDPLGR
jgi:hypothetical protein